MTKITLHAQIDKRLLAAAERLVSEGHFAGVEDALEAALGALVLKYEQDPPSAIARELQRRRAAMDGRERADCDMFLQAYAMVAGHPLDDAETLRLIESFGVFEGRRLMDALHVAQGSKMPLSPLYIETLLDTAERARQEREAGTAPRARIEVQSKLMKEVATLYEAEIGAITEKVANQLRALVEEYPDAARWNEAFAAAAEMNKRNLRYVIGVLRGAGKPKPEAAGRSTGGLSKSKRLRETKRSRDKNYDAYWGAKLKARQDDGTG